MNMKRINFYLSLFLFVIGLLILSLVAVAAVRSDTITFQWNPNSEDDLVGHRLYFSETSGQYSNDSMIDVGLTEPNAEGFCTYSQYFAMVDGDSIYFVLTAYDTAGNESGYSNEVSHTRPSEAPSNPDAFIIVTVVYVRPPSH